MGLRKVPAAGSDNAVGSVEREEGEVTARESRSHRCHLQAVTPGGAEELWEWLGRELWFPLALPSIGVRRHFVHSMWSSSVQ